MPSYEIILERINKDEYNTKMPYPSKPTKAELMEVGNVEREKMLAVYEEKRNYYRISEHEAYQGFFNDCLDYIMKETGIDQTKAIAVYRYSYAEAHSGGYTEILNHLPDLLDLVNHIK